ncbi:MAG: restriction endonuclease [Candidatus Izemoplasmatales bacterium]
MTLFNFAYEFPNTIEEIDRFTGKEFEVFLFEFFKVLEYHPRMTDDTNDKGIDLTIKLPSLDGSKAVGIQAKRWKGKVGPTEIRTMLDGKNHYNLDQVWIITTSDLTPAAITTAKNNDIQILNRENVIEFLEETKKHNVKFRKAKLPKKEIKQTDSNVDNFPSEIIEGFKKLRSEISKTYKLYPVYTVFNNKMMYELINEMPKNIEELSNITGFGKKRVDTFGKEVLEYINKLYKETYFEENDSLLYEILISERSKIAKYNNLSEEDVYTDKVAKYIVRMKPQDKTTLEKVFGFRKENIDIFGDYLIKKIKAFIENNT